MSPLSRGAVSVRGRHRSCWPWIPSKPQQIKISVLHRKDSVHRKTVSSSPRAGKCNLATFSSSSFREEMDGTMVPIMLKICELGLEEVRGDERDQHQPEDNF